MGQYPNVEEIASEAIKCQCKSDLAYLGICL